jgi:Cys-tRNA(Pro)/Cys-tRNA(Cys) deacylase
MGRFWLFKRCCFVDDPHRSDAIEFPFPPLTAAYCAAERINKTDEGAVMTPAIDLAKKRKISHQVHEYTHDASNESFGLEAVEKLGLPPEQVFKTLVVDLGNNTLAVGIIPVSSMLSMKLMAKALGAKKAVMATPADVERSTGYVLGGVSPLGQKKRLKTVIDVSAQNFKTMYVSAGRRGLEIELSPADLKALVQGAFADICQ